MAGAAFQLAFGCECLPFGNERQRSARCFGTLVPVYAFISLDFVKTYERA